MKVSGAVLMVLAVPVAWAGEAATVELKVVEDTIAAEITLDVRPRD